jgi:hypothetical protein
LAVRYVLQPQGDKNTVLRIDAIFVEEFRKIVAHASNGSVEGSEYKDIHDRLDAIDVMKQQTALKRKTSASSCCRRNSCRRPTALVQPPRQLPRHPLPRRLLIHRHRRLPRHRLPPHLLPQPLLRQPLLRQRRRLQVHLLRRSRPSPQSKFPVKLWSSTFRICAARWSGW